MPSPGSSFPSDSAPSLILVTHEFHPHRGGIAVYAAEMARAAQELSYRVEVWAPALPAGAVEPEWPFQVRRLALAGDHSLRSQWCMARELIAQADRINDATLYIPEPGPLLAMLLLQYFDTIRPARLMLTFHGSEIQRLASRRLLRWSTNHLLAKATRISVVSVYARQLFERNFPAAAEKVVVTSGALRSDLRLQQSAPTALPGAKQIVLTVARLNPRKGQLEVINALKALPPAMRKSLEYWLVGAHGKENYDRVLAAAAATADFPVKFLGDIPDDQLGAIYAQASIFAMTSMPHKHSIEGFGLVYLEAGAHGLPIVAHAIGGVPEAVMDGVTGLLVEPGNLPALTDAFARLLADARLRRRLGEAARLRALSRTWRDSAVALLGQPRVVVPT
ncbi:MAG TPA: glycosyltransferase family 4 protein [Lacunisphaera sp.]|nr:glycosyltransferase family 4 protein [Lacunisphaera sp.]